MSLTIEIKDNYAVVHTESESGAREEKPISFRSLRNVLGQNEAVSATGLLPGEYGMQQIVERGSKGLYFYLEAPKEWRIKVWNSSRPEFWEGFYTPNELGISREEGESNEEWLERKKNRWEEKIEEDQVGSKYMHHLRFLTPRLLWTLYARKQNGSYEVIDTFVHALKQSIFSGEENLYQAPVANVYPEHQRICWGDNSVRVPTLKALQGLSTKFFMFPFNDDLDRGRFEEYQNDEGDYVGDFFDFAKDVHRRLERGDTQTDVLAFIESKLIRVNPRYNEYVQRRQNNL